MTTTMTPKKMTSQRIQPAAAGPAVESSELEINELIDVLIAEFHEDRNHTDRKRERDDAADGGVGRQRKKIWPCLTAVS